jgi:hypothetical protein
LHVKTPIQSAIRVDLGNLLLSRATDQVSFGIKNGLFRVIFIFLLCLDCKFILFRSING